MFINQIDEIINNVIDSMYNVKFDIEKKIHDLLDKKILKNINSLLDNRYNTYILNIIEKLILYFIILLSGTDKKDFTKYIINLSTKLPKKLDYKVI